MVWGQGPKGSEAGSKGNWCAASDVAVRTPPLTVRQVIPGGTLPCDAVGPKTEPESFWPQFDDGTGAEAKKTC